MSKLTDPHGTALLEIGTEELPPRFFYDAIEQLQKLAAQKLNEHRLQFDKLDAYGTPRRLVLGISGLPPHQPDNEKETRGPAQASAYDAQGKPTPALSGFLKNQNIPLNSVKIKEFSGKPYVVAIIQEKGKPTAEILSTLFSGLIGQLNFPKSMRWNSSFAFGRPIRWIVSLFEKNVVMFEVSGVKAGNQSYGHRFLSKKTIAIVHPDQYQDELKKGYVIADHRIRKELIRHRLESLAGSKSAKVHEMEPLLDEVNLLVEYPTPFLGSFEERFLTLPQEVLVTVMQHHQRYFPLINPDGKLLNCFIGVRNGNEEGLDEVRFGNEQVIRARFKDAEYFFALDQKTKLADRQKMLSRLVFQKNLGTMAQKVDRLKPLAGELLKERSLAGQTNKEDLDLVIQLCKCDLAAQMVFEFPELQGVIGKEYAKREGYSGMISQAILDHYLPRFPGDRFPETEPGAWVGIADRIDTLVGSFTLKLKPSGSSDPLGLRRAASTLLQLLFYKKMDLKLKLIFQKSLELYLSQFPHLDKQGEPLTELSEFLVERNETLWKNLGIRYDLIRTFAPLVLEKPYSALERARFLEKFRAGEKEKFSQAITAWSRVFNILNSKEALPIVKELTSENKYSPELPGTGSEEKNLFASLTKSEKEVTGKLTEGQPEKAWQVLSELQGSINLFFDKVLVMAPEKDVRKNRLILLLHLRNLMIESFGDLTQIVLD